MTNQHPITPPPELVQQWIKECDRPDDPRWQEYEQDIAARAAHADHRDAGLEVDLPVGHREIQGHWRLLLGKVGRRAAVVRGWVAVVTGIP